jgi:hypothetical protein
MFRFRAMSCRREQPGCANRCLVSGHHCSNFLSYISSGNGFDLSFDSGNGWEPHHLRGEPCADVRRQGQRAKRSFRKSGCEGRSLRGLPDRGVGQPTGSSPGKLTDYRRAVAATLAFQGVALFARYGFEQDH